MGQPSVIECYGTHLCCFSNVYILPLYKIKYNPEQQFVFYKTMCFDIYSFLSTSFIEKNSSKSISSFIQLHLHTLHIFVR
nr:MAG TPA: hypothetical protein [Caudoviricetes sp.]